MTLVFVRHGESEVNTRDIVQGWLDLPLSERGRSDAARVAGRLAVLDVAAVYCSDLARASETASVIAAPHELTPLPRTDLRERCWGEAQGLSREAIDSRFGPNARTGSGLIPGEETLPVFRERVVPTLTELAVRHANDLAVVATHNGTILAVLADVLEVPPDRHPPFALANGGVTVIEGGASRRIVAVNDTAWPDSGV
jgi:broad specificity phosphatase PhoE